MLRTQPHPFAASPFSPEPPEPAEEAPEYTSREPLPADVLAMSDDEFEALLDEVLGPVPVARAA
jgi:hypothetical protein